MVHRNDAVEDRSNLLAAINARQQQQADLIHKSRLKEPAVDMATTFQE